MGLFAKYKKNRIFKNVIWMFSGQGLHLLLQGAYFVVIARVLGVNEYGAFVGVVALSSILSPFSTCGRGNLLIKAVARDQKLFREYWGNALLVTFAMGLLLVLSVALTCRWFLPRHLSLLMIVLTSASELILRKVVDVSAQAFQAFERLFYTAKLPVVLSGMKLISSVMMVSWLRRTDALTWSYFYFGASLITAIGAISLVRFKVGSPCIASWRIKEEFKEGVYFSIGLSSQTIYNDIDKAMLARFSTLSATGLYAAAYRIIDASFVPVRALLSAAYPRFFKHGVNGVIGATKFARRLAGAASIYGVFVALVLYAVAPIMPRILGNDYASTVQALRWLALLPLLKSIHYFAADSLTGAGLQGTRTVIQFSVALFNVLINLWIIPVYSWRGAAWSSLASDGLLAISLWGVLLLLCRREGRSIIVSRSVSLDRNFIPSEAD